MAALKKKPAKSSPEAAATNTTPAQAKPTMPPPKSGVKVRMYKQGLGDCFLLAFPTTHADKAFYLLIDCGVILGTSDSATTMQKVAESIASATGGDIHLLVATHEHWDHVSGFLQANEVFDRLRIHNLWLAWTEDPTDELANSLRKEFSKDREALRLAVNRAFSPNSVEGVRQLMEFFGEVPSTANDGPALAAKDDADSSPGADTGAALKELRRFLGKQQREPEYRHPGEPVLPLPAVPGLGAPPGVRVYVLGPPHDEDTLRKVNPTAKGKEVYTESSALTARTAFLMATLPEGSSLPSEDQELRELSFPFDARLRIPFTQAAQEDFFKTRYGFEQYQARVGAANETSPVADAATHPNAWRRIDDDWLGAAGELALKLDSFTNNTSLALAIELVDTGKVLLFAADAQVGNWLSWANLSWTVADAKKQERKVRVEDLLAKTVLYKVGHHASHNATMRAQGLELMTSPELVAMVPVDAQVAHEIKHWMNMPFEPLLQRLAQKTQGRVMRVDERLSASPPKESSPAVWAEFRKKVQETDLYFEYEVSG